MKIGDNVLAKTGDGLVKGRIVGRTLEGEPKFDVRTEKKILVNVPQDYVQPAASTCKSTPLAAPETTNVSQSNAREISYAAAAAQKQVA